MKRKERKRTIKKKEKEGFPIEDRKEVKMEKIGGKIEQKKRCCSSSRNKIRFCLPRNFETATSGSFFLKAPAKDFEGHL